MVASVYWLMFMLVVQQRHNGSACLSDGIFISSVAQYSVRHTARA